MTIDNQPTEQIYQEVAWTAILGMRHLRDALQLVNNDFHNHPLALPNSVGVWLALTPAEGHSLSLSKMEQRTVSGEGVGVWLPHILRAARHGP